MSVDLLDLDQSLVLKVLRESRNPLRAEEINERLLISFGQSRVIDALSALLIHGHVETDDLIHFVTLR